jgi:hypothetical protein
MQAPKFKNHGVGWLLFALYFTSTSDAGNIRLKGRLHASDGFAVGGRWQMKDKWQMKSLNMEYKCSMWMIMDDYINSDTGHRSGRRQTAKNFFPSTQTTPTNTANVKRGQNNSQTSCAGQCNRQGIDNGELKEGKCWEQSMLQYVVYRKRYSNVKYQDELRGKRKSEWI